MTEPTQQPSRAAAEEPAAAEPVISDEEAQSAASDALDELTMPATAETVVGQEGQAPVSHEVVGQEGQALVSQEPDYKDRYLRASAEMDNVRKRARRDIGAAQDRGVARLAKELLPAIDNLERALQAAESAEGEGEHVITKGIRLVQAEFVGALTRAGITIEDPKGQPFDPHRHEALAQTPVEGTPAGVVVEVYQPGYVLADTVIRAARVVVSG